MFSPFPTQIRSAQSSPTMGGLSAAACFQKKTLFEKKIHNSPTKNASFNDVLIFGNNSAMDTSFEKSSSHFEQQIDIDRKQS